MADIIQLKIELNYTNPLIWRSVQVESKITFKDLHMIIQKVMGWKNCHMHEFDYSGYRLAVPNKEFDDDFGVTPVNTSETSIGLVLTEECEECTYTYDFGDSWEHRIIVEQLLPRIAKMQYPVCIGGQYNCPPEDCGGIPGFYNMLEIIKSKDHPDKEEMLSWLGSKYDPEKFEIEKVNKKLLALGKRRCKR